MKRFILSLFIAVFTVAAVSAQNSNASYSAGSPAPNATAEERAKDATDRLNNIVNLTQDQYNQVLQVNRNFFSSASAYGNGRPAARVNAGREQQLKTILNGDQWQTYQNARQQGQAF